MHLKPIYPIEPECLVWCAKCGKTTPSGVAFADLDAKPGTYYCPKCADESRFGYAEDRRSHSPWITYEED